MQLLKIIALTLVTIYASTALADSPITIPYEELIKQTEGKFESYEGTPKAVLKLVARDLEKKFYLSELKKVALVKKMIDYTYSVDGNQYYTLAFGIIYDGLKKNCDSEKFVNESCRYDIRGLTYKQEPNGEWKFIEKSEDAPHRNNLYNIDNVKLLGVFTHDKEQLHVLARVNEVFNYGHYAHEAEIITKTDSGWNVAGSITLSEDNHGNREPNEKGYYSFKSDMLIQPHNYLPSITLKRTGTDGEYSQEKQDIVVSKAKDQIYENPIVPYRYELKK